MTLTLSNQQVELSEGITLAYYDSEASLTDTNAKNSKSVVVLLHGYCGSSAYFSKLAPLLAQRYRLLIPDLLGHGHSSPLKQETYNMEEQASFIVQWLQGIGIDGAYVFGHSLGGYITLALAEQGPKLLQGFGLLHSTALPDSEQAKQNRELAIIKVQEQGVTAFVDGLVPKLFAADHPQYEQLLRYGIEIGYQTAPEAVAGFARGMKERSNRAAVIQRSSLPVLLIAGAKDGVVSPEGTFTGSHSGTACHVLAEAGHMGMLETPAEMAELLRQFIG